MRRVDLVLEFVLRSEVDGEKFAEASFHARSAMTTVTSVNMLCKERY